MGMGTLVESSLGMSNDMSVKDRGVYQNSLINGKSYMQSQDLSIRTSGVHRFDYFMGKCQVLINIDRSVSSGGGLSSFTNERNMIASDEINRFRQKTVKDEVVDTADKDMVQKLLKKTEKELKCLSYKLSTVVSDGNYHNLIQEGPSTSIEVIEETYVYCKIGLKYKFSPMKLRLKYNRKEKLRVYLSTENKMPDHSSCEQEYQKPSVITLWAPARTKEFTKEYVYLALWCPNQISVKMSVHFNTMEKALGKKKLEKQQLTLEADEERHKLFHENRIKILKSVQLSNKKHGSHVPSNHIAKNIKIAFNWKKMSEKRLEDHKVELPKKLDHIKANQKKIFLSNLKQVRYLMPSNLTNGLEKNVHAAVTQKGK